MAYLDLIPKANSVGVYSSEMDVPQALQEWWISVVLETNGTRVSFIDRQNDSDIIMIAVDGTISCRTGKAHKDCKNLGTVKTLQEAVDLLANNRAERRGILAQVP